MHKLFRDRQTRADTRQKLLILDMPRGPTPRKKLTHVSPRVAEEYAGKGDRTLSRDINELIIMNLIIKEGADYRPNHGLILAFLPPRFEEHSG